ncbi:MAG TPA: GldG family protein [Bryobacteraceae bacterium]|nr:GldG family protein [Bryobacteraceae bacterium]
MAANWMKSRQTKYSVYATIYTLVVLAVLAAINFLGNRYDKSYDATSNKQFSLSDQTIKLVKGLKTDATLTYFGDNASFQTAKDTLDRYSDLSPKVHAVYVDPTRKPEQAKAAGYRSDSPVIVAMGDKKEGAKALTEEEITGALLRAESTGDRNVCFLSAAGEHSIDDTGASGYSAVKQLVEQDNYKTRTITPKGAAPEAGKTLNVQQAAAPQAFEVPKDCTVLVAAGPQTDYPQSVVDGLKSYIEGGGRGLFLLDETLKLGRGQSPADNAPLLGLLAGWGVTVNKDLVLDLSGLGGLFGLGPEVPFITQYPTHTVTQPLSGVPTAFPLSRSIDIKNADKTTLDKLIATTEDSLATTEIGPGGAVDPKKGKKGPFNIAVAGTYTGSPNGRFIVVGTSEWAENSLAGSRRLANGDLFANMINWLASQEDLISIRPKSTADQPMNLTVQRLTTLFWLSIVIFPLAVVGFGLGTWWKRR